MKTRRINTHRLENRRKRNERAKRESRKGNNAYLRGRWLSAKMLFNGRTMFDGSIGRAISVRLRCDSKGRMSPWIQSSLVALGLDLGWNRAISKCQRSNLRKEFRVAARDRQLASRDRSFAFFSLVFLLLLAGPPFTRRKYFPEPDRMQTRLPSQPYTRIRLSFVYPLATAYRPITIQIEKSTSMRYVAEMFSALRLLVEERIVANHRDTWSLWK